MLDKRLCFPSVVNYGVGKGPGDKDNQAVGNMFSSARTSGRDVTSSHYPVGQAQLRNKSSTGPAPTFCTITNPSPISYLITKLAKFTDT